LHEIDAIRCLTESPSVHPISLATSDGEQHSAASSLSAATRQLLNDLVQFGWAQDDLFLPADLMRALGSECIALHFADQLRVAAIGRGDGRTLSTATRGDQIAWLNAGQSDACDAYLALMEDLRLALNAQLFLGLDHFESHFAFYEPGKAYAAHRDRFRDHGARTISAVIYLNQEWLPEHGGALRLHPEGAAIHDVAPIACRLILFTSADMLHEVLPATRDRMSLAGWYRRRY
jgi:SM-20-related protein